MQQDSFPEHPRLPFPRVQGYRIVDELCATQESERLFKDASETLRDHGVSIADSTIERWRMLWDRAKLQLDAFQHQRATQGAVRDCMNAYIYALRALHHPELDQDALREVMDIYTDLEWHQYVRLLEEYVVVLRNSLH